MTRSIAEVAITGCTIQHSSNYSGKEFKELAPGGAIIRFLGKEIAPIDSITITGNGERIEWLRDTHDPYAFHIDVPAGVRDFHRLKSAKAADVLCPNVLELGILTDMEVSTPGEVLRASRSLLASGSCRLVLVKHLAHAGLAPNEAFEMLLVSRTDAWHVATPLLPFTFAQCAVTPGDVSLLTSLPVAAVTTSFDTSTVYFATLTAVYRLFLQTNTLELLAGAEGTAAVGVVAAGTSTTGTLARFADGLNWSEIRRLDPSTPLSWWRGAVFNGELDGLLVWLGGRWWLTDAGRDAVRSVA
jgi:hypothetical protein